MAIPVQAQPASQQLQQFVNGITARLAQLAKEPPDLVAYLRVHAECIANAFKPVGFAYEMRNGAVFQRVLQANLESLAYKEFPEQENAFGRAVKVAAEKRKPVLLTPHSEQSTGVQGLTAEDSPAPDELPLFNRTAYEQHFVPIPLAETTTGVLHIWFPPGNTATAHTRSVLLKQICAETELYFKARQARDVTAEITRLSTHARLLEELAGDIEVESVSWNLVNFAREAVACERVCLFIATNADRALSQETVAVDLEYEFRLQACSGLKKPHPRSEQALILQRVAQKLTQISLVKAAALLSPPTAVLPVQPGPTPPGPEAVNGTAPGEPAADHNREIQPTPPAPPAVSGVGRPRTPITLMMRDPSKTATRAAEINEYFDLMPMNWATVIPLFDRNERVCGILLFEGVKADEKVGGAFKPMMELAGSAGRALGTALYCSQHRSMRVARKLVSVRQHYVNTPVKRRLLRVGLPFLLLVGFLIFPIQYRIKGDASVLAVKQSALPPLVSARLLEVLAREGETVKAGQVLARFETRDLELQLGQYEQERERSLLEGDTALANGNESQMQISRLNADKANAMVVKLRTDIQHAEIRAPFDGIVLGAQTLSTRLGEILKIGEPALQVVDPASWQVKANLREKDLIFLDQRLRQTGPVPAALRLAADPAQKYDLELNSSDQLAYGLDTAHGEYEFTAVLPMKTAIDNPKFLKSGFTGRISFAAGQRPIAYVLFRDFIQYVTVRFF